MGLTIPHILHPLTCDLQSCNAVGFPWIQWPDVCQNLCVCPQNSERGFSSPSSGIFLLIRYFRALKQSEHFMPLWTVQLFQIYLSNGKVDFLGGISILFSSFFEAVAFIPEQTFSFQGDPSKALDCVCNYYNFPHPFVIPGFWLVCTNIVRYQPDMLLIVWFLCFPIWLLSFLVSAHYFGFDAAKVPEVGNTVFAGWTEHCSQAEITAALSTINADWARSLIQSQSIFREWCDMSGCHYPPSKNKIEKHLHFLYTLLEFFVSALKCQMCFYDKWISSFWSGGEAKWFLRDISVPFTSWCAVLHIYCMTSAGLDRRSIQECSSDIYGIRC